MATSMIAVTVILLIVVASQSHARKREEDSTEHFVSDILDALVGALVNVRFTRWHIETLHLKSSTLGKPTSFGPTYGRGNLYTPEYIPAPHIFASVRQDARHHDKVVRTSTNAAAREMGVHAFGMMREQRPFTLRRGSPQPTNVVAQALPSWQQSMLRIKDPSKSLPFYMDKMGMRLLDKLDFDSMGFSLYFLASIPADEQTPEPGTSEAHKYLWNFPGTTLELTHNYGTEKEDGAVYHAGNQPQEGNMRDGFGHIAFTVGNVFKFCELLEEAGVNFQKKPNEGRMKGLAFALDPDGYWVELLGRGDHITPPCLAQTMLRVKDPSKSIEFYTKYFGMKVLNQGDYGDFALYYLGSSNYKEGCPVLELTHNYGTETDPAFVHFSGNEDGRKGFGHVGFLVDDVYETCTDLQEAGYELQKAPDAGSMKGLAFVRDPDGYWVEVIKRGGYDAQATPYFFEESRP